MSELMPELEKRVAALWTLANIATLIGLLGTITGLIKAFGAVAHAEASQCAVILSAGISEAMWTTALGLGLAEPRNPWPVSSPRGSARTFASGPRTTIPILPRRWAS